MVNIPKKYFDIQLTKKPHVYILGTGASRASQLNKDTNNFIPLMNDLADVIELKTYVDKDLYSDAKNDFESFFDTISKNPDFNELKEYIEDSIYDYFKSISILKKVTLYDRLVLSLRAKDAIATFNWDPLLCYAYRRNGCLKTLPELFFLHGNVLSGYCLADKVFGWIDDKCKKCNNKFQPIKLLYPVTEKNYSEDPIIKYQWGKTCELIRNSFLITIFGYSAPFTDTDARDRIVNQLKNNKKELDILVFISLGYL